MHSFGGLLYHALSPFVPTEFSLLTDLIDAAVWAKHAIEGTWYSLTARADGSCRSSACPKVLRYVPPPQRRRELCFDRPENLRKGFVTHGT